MLGPAARAQLPRGVVVLHRSIRCLVLPLLHYLLRPCPAFELTSDRGIAHELVT